MSALLDALALTVTDAGLLVVLAAGLRARGRDGLQMALTLWMGAGLLRLAAAPEWRRIVACAAIVGVRQLVSLAMRHISPRLDVARPR